MLLAISGVLGLIINIVLAILFFACVILYLVNYIKGRAHKTYELGAWCLYLVVSGINLSFNFLDPTFYVSLGLLILVVMRIYVLVFKTSVKTVKTTKKTK